MVNRRIPHCIAGLALFAAFSAPAFSQSSLSLYGLADVFIGTVKNPGAHTAVVSQGNGMSSSYWGMTGVEDLGGGYTAFFLLESYFQPQNGTYGRFAGDSFFSRNSYVGIKTPYGTVRSGLITVPLYLQTLKFNPFFNSYTFSPIIFHTYKGLGTQGVVGDSVWNNAVAYTAPTFGGVTLGGVYGFSNAGGEAGQHKWTVNAAYAQGPLELSAVYQNINFVSSAGDIANAFSVAPGLSSQRTTQLAASYDFKFVKLFAQYMNISNHASIGNFTDNTGQLGVSIPFHIGFILASGAYSKSSDGSGRDDRRTTLSVGYDYPLSKRTDVYIAYKYDHFARESTGMTYGGGLRTRF